MFHFPSFWEFPWKALFLHELTLNLLKNTEENAAIVLILYQTIIQLLSRGGELQNLASLLTTLLPLNVHLYFGSRQTLLGHLRLAFLTLCGEYRPESQFLTPPSRKIFSMLTDFH